MGKHTIILALTARRKSWIYQVLSFVVSRDTSHRTGIMLLVGNFTGVMVMNFIPDWESVIGNQSGQQINLSEN